MQKHFAVVTGIGMLAVAGLVFSQQTGLFDSSLQGSLTNSFPTMASSVPGGYTPPAFPMSLSSSSTTPCGGSRGMCGGTCGNPGWTCQWDPRASNGSCVCTDPGFCNSVPSCGTVLAPFGDPRCGTMVDCCNAGVRSTTAVQCSSPSSIPWSPCADNGGAPGTGGCCAGAVEVNGGCWQPCTGPNMGPGCIPASSTSSPPNCDAEREAVLNQRILVIAKVNAYKGKVAEIEELEAEKREMIASGALGSQAGAVILQYRINTLVEELNNDLPALNAAKSEYTRLLNILDACLAR